MKFKTMCSAALLLAAVALSIAPASGDETALATRGSARESYEQAHRFEVGPIIGYHFFEGKQNLDDSFTYGGRLGYNFTKRFGLEVGMGKVDADVDDKTKTGAFKGQYRSPTSSVDLTSYHLNAIYQFNPDRRFTPFVTAGLGRITYDPEMLYNDMDTFDYGVGAKYWMQRDMALRVDLKDQMGSSLHNYSATIELVFALGGRPKPAPDQAVQPEPIPEPKPIVVQEQPVSLEAVPDPEERIITLVFEDVHFKFDRSTLTDEAKDILQRNIQILKDNPKVRVRIAGYTSASGSDEYNQRLSVRRARSVEKYVVNVGNIAPERLTTIGYGEANPAEYEANPKQLYSKAARANMRVLFETIVK